MQTPAISTIISRAITIIVLFIAVIYGLSFYKKVQRKSAIIKELRELSSDNSFFRQFYAEDAAKTLVRSVGLILEAKSMGMAPDVVVDKGLNREKSILDGEAKEFLPASDLIRATLLNNYDNAVKLGYTADYRTLADMKTGALPTIPAGPNRGSTAEITPIIDPQISPGLEKVVANLAIRPPGYSKQPKSDVDLAAAKRLAGDLQNAGIIEQSVAERILKTLSPPKEEGK